jgi:hypothetical protein
MVSGASGPRWLLPARPNAATLAAAGTWRPYDRAARLKWHGLVTAWRLGTAASLPNVAKVSIVGADALSPPAVHIGTPDRRQKAILFHPAAEAQPAMVRKVAVADDAVAAIAHEAAALHRLAVIRPGLAPALLETASGSISMAWLDGDPVPARLDEAILGQLAALRLDQDIDTVGEQDLPDRLPAFIEHGDFVPWNIRRQAAQLYLLDWEDAAIPGLPLQDLVGWSLAVGHFIQRRPVIEVLRRERPILRAFAARIGVEASTVPPLVRLYLARRRKRALDRGDTAYASALATALTAPPEWA